MGAVNGPLRKRLKDALADTNAGNQVADILDGNKVRNVQVGASTAAVAERYGASETEGLERYVLDKTITLTNAVSAAVATIPANSTIISVQANLQTAVTGDGSGDNGLAAVGIGISGTVDKYGESAALTKNTKVDTKPAAAVLASAEPILLYATDGLGAACTEKFTAGGEVRVLIVYDTLNSLDNAA